MLERRDTGRQRILEGAIRILDEGALADFTVDSLARNLHMSKSTLYKYFESKDHVVVMLVEAACRDTLASLEAFDPASGPSASDALRRLGGVLADHSDRVPAAIALAYGNLPSDANAQVARVREEVRARLGAVLARGKRSGEFQVIDPVVAAAGLHAAFEEVVQQAARGVGTLGRGAALRAQHEMFMHGLIAHS